MARNTGTTHRFGPALSTLLIVVVAYVCLFMLISTAIAPVQYDLKAGAVAPITITATKDVEDELATQRLIEAAERSVEPSYMSDSSVMEEVMMQMRDAFRHLVTVNGLNKAPDGSTVEITPNLLWQAANALSPLSMDESFLIAVMEEDMDTIARLRDQTNALVLAVVSEPFWQGHEGTVIERITRELTDEGFSDKLVETAIVIVREYLRPNMVLDEAAFEQNRQKAREEVEPVIYKSGQNIVRAGEVITASQMAILDSLGMLKDRGMDWPMYLGIGMTLLLMIGMIALYLYTFEPELLEDSRRIALLATIVVMVVAISLPIRNFSTFYMPVTLGAMLTALLLKPRLALTTGVMLSVMTGMIVSSSGGVFSTAMFAVFLNSIFSSSLCVTIIRKRQHRSGILLAGIAVAVANMMTTVAAGLINNANLRNVFINAMQAAGGGMGSAVLCIILQLVLEWIFNIDTSTKLLELSNPNQPLLRRLLLEAPGTYHHSILVANLAEAGASAIGANGLLARVGAYYHDIGKLKRPLYFKENQLNDNPHDRTDPRVSAAILTAHPTDGMQMAQKSRLPIPIQEIIVEHHGDTPTLYFYDKAIKQGLEVDIVDFRYPGPRPRTRESAIVMMADTVEASSRALRESSPEKMRQLIQKMIRDKMDDGQLDDCPLTFNDLKLICDAFLTVLTGVYHQRIEYPAIEIPQRELPEGQTPEEGGEKLAATSQAIENAQPEKTQAQPAQEAPGEEDGAPAMEREA